MDSFKCLVIYLNENGSVTRKVETKSISDLPENELLIKVHYSSLNYKDSLSANGNKGITRSYPHTPGIDASGEIVKSSCTEFKNGDQVIINGHDFGMNTHGGFSEYISVPKEWVIKLPKGFTTKEAMEYGTAGFTAAMALNALVMKQEITPEMGPILVTGASGGVGSFALLMAKKAGFKTIAATRKIVEAEFFKNLKVDEVIDSKELLAENKKPLLERKWIGIIDTVGGEILSNAIKHLDYHGGVSICGNALSASLNTTVFPLILRNTSFFGIDSAHISKKYREIIWSKISSEWRLLGLENINKLVSLDELSKEIDLIFKGKQKGKVLIEL